MWTKLPGKNRLAILLGSIMVIIGLSLTGVWAQEKKTGKTPTDQPKAASSQIVVSGKVFCSLRRPVPLPFPGLITDMRVKPGQPVKKGEVLARYRLAPEAALKIQRRLAPARLKELEVKLAEIEKNLAELKGKLNGIRQLAREKLASAQKLSQVQQQHQFLLQQRQAVKKALSSERKLAREEQAVLKYQLGTSISSERIPPEADLVSPINGHVLWIHPEFKEGAQLKPTAPVFLVGVMDPMLIRARVHEIEAMQLQVGDKAQVSLESLPGRTFEAQVTRLPWSSSTPSLEHPSYFDVEFNVANPELILKEGLKAQVVLEKSN